MSLVLDRIRFSDSGHLIMHLSNCENVLISLTKVELMQTLTRNERLDYEIIDGQYLSSFSLDEVWHIDELLGLTR